MSEATKEYCDLILAYYDKLVKRSSKKVQSLYKNVESTCFLRNVIIVCAKVIKKCILK